MTLPEKPLNGPALSAVDVPVTLAANAVMVWGDAGRDWIARLPALVSALCDDWELRPVPADFTLSYNFVLAVERRDGQPAALKTAFPGPDFLGELTALQVYNGDGMCAVLEQDPARGAVLLERVQPGVPLLELDETAEAVAAAVSVMHRLRKPLPSGHRSLPSLPAQWRRALDGLRRRSGGKTAPLPPDLVALADETYTTVAADTDRYVVLHGDLHHWNILSSQRAGWLAIDPHGVLGPPECEVGAFMINPNNGVLVRPDVRDVLARRLDQFAAELRVDREWLRRLSVAYGMLSAAWSTEDGGDRWRPTLDVVRALLQA